MIHIRIASPKLKIKSKASHSLHFVTHSYLSLLSRIPFAQIFILSQEIKDGVHKTEEIHVLRTEGIASAVVLAVRLLVVCSFVGAEVENAEDVEG